VDKSLLVYKEYLRAHIPGKLGPAQIYFVSFVTVPQAQAALNEIIVIKSARDR
jgi:hypothetical protein